MINVELTEFIRGKIKLYQPIDGYRFNLDSVLLSHFVSISKRKGKLLDLGTGSGIIILLLALKYPDLEYHAVEIQTSLYNLAKENFKINNLNVNLLNEDIRNLKNVFKPNFFDYIVSNPPYFKPTKKLTKNEEINIARYELKLNLEDIFSISKYLLKDRGKLFLIFPSDRISELIKEGENNRFKLKRARFIYPSIEDNSTHILAEFVKNARDRTSIEKPLIVYKDKKEKIYTDEVNYILEKFT